MEEAPQKSGKAPRNPIPLSRSWGSKILTQGPSVVSLPSLPLSLCLDPLPSQGHTPHTHFPGYREVPSIESDGMQKQADHCNDRRMASKRVQELSTGLFFAILVKVRTPHTRPNKTPVLPGPSACNVSGLGGCALLSPGCPLPTGDRTAGV